jgi:hypothetical protein
VTAWLLLVDAAFLLMLNLYPCRVSDPVSSLLDEVRLFGLIDESLAV